MKRIIDRICQIISAILLFIMYVGALVIVYVCLFILDKFLEEGDEENEKETKETEN